MNDIQAAVADLPETDRHAFLASLEDAAPSTAAVALLKSNATAADAIARRISEAEQVRDALQTQAARRQTDFQEARAKLAAWKAAAALGEAVGDAPALPDAPDDADVLAAVEARIGELHRAADAIAAHANRLRLSVVESDLQKAIGRYAKAAGELLKAAAQVEILGAMELSLSGRQRVGQVLNHMRIPAAGIGADDLCSVQRLIIVRAAERDAISTGYARIGVA